MPERPVYITTREIADLMDAHLTTVQYWLKTGKLYGEKLGTGQRSMWLVTVDDFETFRDTYTKWQKSK